MTPATGPDRALDIAVVGSGISGLSAAWLLSRQHRVTLFEADRRLGGHSNTVDVCGVAVDTGFIVYNEATYPNLVRLFDHLGVETAASDMSFAVSLDRGRLEYSGTSLGGLFAQPINAVRPRFLRMLRDLLRFYREAPADLASLGDRTLDDYLDEKRISRALRDDHLYPMAAAIWSTPAERVGDYPAAAFIRFCDNHGLLKVTDRPIWRTVVGGSRSYVERLARRIAGDVLTGTPVAAVRRLDGGVEIVDGHGNRRRFDHIVLACHSNQALALLEAPSEAERTVLGALGYSRNEAVLHSDETLMPVRRKVWSSWNYLAEAGSGGGPSVTYWMNRLQPIGDERPLFVTLNPLRQPRADSVVRRESYEHPLFNQAAMAAQKRLWSLQGRGNTWFCGAYFGAGFHEDGLQAGLAVAEALGGVRRPWTVAGESSRIHVGETAARGAELELTS